MIDLELYRKIHKKEIITQIENNGLDILEFTVSLYAATNMLKIIACYIYTAEHYGYDMLVNERKDKNVLDCILSLIRSYTESEITGMVGEYPEALKPFIK